MRIYIENSHYKGIAGFVDYGGRAALSYPGKKAGFRPSQTYVIDGQEWKVIDFGLSPYNKEMVVINLERA